jgi:hypothetical protein
MRDIVRAEFPAGVAPRRAPPDRPLLPHGERSETGSVDFFCSTSTLEHIPPDDILAILTVCRRVATRDARFSFIIDYHDHYASADPSITRVNFYRYTDSLWRLYNPPNHFQNRLRHSDYEALFEKSGLRAEEVRAITPAIAIDKKRLSERFRRYSDRDLMALNGLFLLHG